MKLQQVTISFAELQDYLDKYQEKIKFIFHFDSYLGGVGPNQFLLIIDMS